MAWGPAAHRARHRRGHRHPAQGAAGLLQGPPAGDALPVPRRPRPAEDAPERRFAVDRLLPFPFPTCPAPRPRCKERFAGGGGEGRPPALAHPGVLRAAGGGLPRRRQGAGSSPSPTPWPAWSPTCTTRWPSPTTRTARRPASTACGCASRVRLPDAMDKRLKLDPDAAHFLDDPKGLRVLHDERDLRLARQPALRGGARAARQVRATPRSTTRPWSSAPAPSCATASSQAAERRRQLLVHGLDGGRRARS